MKYPSEIDAASLDALPSGFEPGDYDEHEPLLLEAVRVEAADMEALRHVPFALDGCVVEGCDLSLAQIRGVKHSRIENSKLRGSVFANYLLNVAFQKCRLTECVFRMMGLKDISFADSQLTDCDFYGSELTRLTFDGSSFEGVGFDACTIDELDMRAMSNLLIGDPRTLVGATLCETQIPLIAHRLAVLSGIKVDDC